jgi:hypothetical protein
MAETVVTNRHMAQHATPRGLDASRCHSVAESGTVVRR